MPELVLPISSSQYDNFVGIYEFSDGAKLIEFRDADEPVEHIYRDADGKGIVAPRAEQLDPFSNRVFTTMGVLMSPESLAAIDRDPTVLDSIMVAAGIAR